MFRITAATGLLLVAGLAHAHHGTAGQFDATKEIRLTGVITKMNFVNPHSYVYFDVKGADGKVENWRCEMRSATVLRRSGWTPEMFKVGTVINVDGRPARREPTGCYTEEVAFPDGIVIKRYDVLAGAENNASVKHDLRTADDKPNFAGEWAADQRLLGNLANVPAGGPPGAAGPPGTGGPGRGGNQYKQTKAGVDASADFKREDNPRFHCMATNIFADWTFDQMVNRVEQDKTSIKLTYGFMDIVRTIHLDQTAHPKTIKPSRAGHSIGKWDGDTLVVDTVGFLPGYLNGNNGMKHSDKLHVVERFSLSADGRSLIRTWTGTDPLYLTEPFEGKDEIKLSATKFEPYNCKDLTEERVKGF